ncbi:MAG: EI24 domain-containing protein [Nitrospirae bacterium]|nr:EI24 domain-containing protein [Nitrospirota bacterium]
MLSGLLSLFRALGLFRVHPRLLLLLMLAPWTINLILFLGGWSVLTVWMTGMVDPYLESLASGWWQALLVGFGNFVAVVLAAGVAYLITIIGAVLVAAPFHDRLSAAVERAARPASAGPARRMGVLAAFREGARTAAVLLVLEVALLPLLLFPGVGHVLFALLSALVLTLGILDVPLARHELTLRQKAAFAWRRLPQVAGLSLGVLAVSPVPFLNLLTLPVIVMAATLLVVEAEGPLA